MNLVNLLEESAQRHSWRRCLVWSRGSFSFSALNKKVNQLTGGLKKLGVKKGDKVAILLNNCPEFIIAFFAVLKARAICVPLNVFLTFNELKYIIKDSQTKLIISSADFRQILEEFLRHKQEETRDRLSLEEIILVDKKLDSFIYWEEITVKERDLSSDIGPEDLALLIYTSGTTGFPKGVMLSHANLCANVISSLRSLEITPQDRILLILPMFHSFTLMVCILVPIYAGARIVIAKSVRPFQRVLRSVLFERITIIVGIPHLFDILKNLNLPPLLQWLLRVKVCISGAAPLSVETLQTFQQRFKKIALLEGYGLTEASPVVSLNPLQGIRKAGSIGLPVPGVEVKVVRDDESEAQCGEIGELIVKGANVMCGYFNLPEETKKTIRNSWLFTGDMAKIDEDGYIYIVGRKKEMILSHGMNVYPQEIENVLLKHPKIKEAAVVGRKDKARGEVPVAFIVLKEGCFAHDYELINYCKDKLANYKIPHLIEFRESLPKTPTGKILKRKLVE